MAALRLASGGKQTGTATASTGTSVTATITEIDITKSIILWSYQGGASTPATSSVRAYFSSLTGNLSDQITFDWFSTTSVNLDFRWTVLTFDAGITVQHFSPALTSDGQTQSITTVDTATSFVIPMGVRKSGSTFSQDDVVRYTLASTQVTMHVEEASPSDLSVSFSVVDIDDCTVDVITSTKTTSTEVAYSESAGSSFTDIRTIFFGSMEFTSGADPDDMLWCAFTADAGSGLVRVERNTGASLTFTWTIFVIEFTEGSGGPLVTKDAFTISSGTDDGTDDFTPAVSSLSLAAVHVCGLVNGWPHPVTSYNTWSNGWNNVFCRYTFVDTDTVSADRDSGASSAITINYWILEVPEASGTQDGAHSYAGAGTLSIATKLKPTPDFTGAGSLSIQSKMKPEIAFGGAGTLGIEAKLKPTLSFAGAGSLAVVLDAEVDCYPNTNTDDAIPLGFVAGAAQSFEGNGGYLTRVRVEVARNATPGGTLACKLFAHSGTFGTSSVPTGTALETSSTTYDAATLSTSPTEVEFTFAGTTLLTNGTHYCVVLDGVTGNITNRVDVSTDQSSPTAPGNAAQDSGGWGALSGEDMIFCVFSTVPQVVSGDTSFAGAGSLSIQAKLKPTLSFTGAGSASIAAKQKVTLAFTGAGSASVGQVRLRPELLFAGLGTLDVNAVAQTSDIVEVIIVEEEAILVLDVFTEEEYMSLLDIWNVGLARLGISPVTSAPASDGSDAGDICAGSWPLFKEKFLRDSSWDGAKKTATLATFKEADATTAVSPTARWNFAYALPTDHVRSLRLNGWENAPGPKERAGLGLWEEEVVANSAGTRARCLLANDSTASLEYIFLIPDSEITLCPADMRWAMALSFAAHIAPFFGKTQNEIVILEGSAEIARRDARRSDDQTGARLTNMDDTIAMSFF